MLKVLCLVLVAAAVAVGAGLRASGSALQVGSVTLSQSDFDHELSAIRGSPGFQCYLEARAFTASRGQTQGPSFASTSSQAAALWADQRVTQLAVEPFVLRRDPGAFAPAALTAARTTYELSVGRTLLGAFDQSAQAQFSCAAVVAPGGQRLLPAATILSTLPSWFMDEQVRAEAANLGLINLLPGRLPESGPALRHWYGLHASQFDTTCINDIETVSASAARSVKSKIEHGLSFADAARKYSKDTGTSHKGGRIGCYSPNSAAWPTVAQYVGSTPTGGIAIVPINGAYVLFSPTKRTPNSFAAVAVGVAAQLHNVNVQNAGVLGTVIQQATPVSVASWLGTWTQNGVGGEVQPVDTPPTAAVTNPAANSPTG